MIEESKNKIPADIIPLYKHTYKNTIVIIGYDPKSFEIKTFYFDKDTD